MSTFSHERMFNRVSTTLQLAHLALLRFQVTFTLIICKCAFHGNSKLPAKPNLHVCKWGRVRGPSRLNPKYIARIILSWSIHLLLDTWTGQQIVMYLLILLREYSVTLFNGRKLRVKIWTTLPESMKYIKKFGCCIFGPDALERFVSHYSLFSPNSNLFFPRMMPVCAAASETQPFVNLFIK